jgi:hypothetical protein
MNAFEELAVHHRTQMDRLVAERDEARVIARQRAADVQYLLDHCLREPHSQAIGVKAIRARLAAFDALPWAKES